MTVAVLDAPRLGSTEARIFTPPHPDNQPEDWREEIDGCGHEHIDGLTCETSWGYDCIDYLTLVVGWVLLPWQRWLYIHALEKGLNGRGFRFKTLVITVARQNGKTKWLKGLGLWRMFLDELGRSSPACPAARILLITAQNLDYAEGFLADVVNEVKDNPELRGEFLTHKETNGKHRMILTGRRFWRAATASRRGGRSLSVDLAILDELREHLSWDAWEAIVPSTTARPFSQVVCASNAGDARSIVLRSQRDVATKAIMQGRTEDTQTGYYEWSVPMEEDPHDPAFWYMANPSMGYLEEFSLDTLLGYLESMEFTNMPGFRTEFLCQWVDTLQPGILPAEDWSATMDSISHRAPESPIYAAVDVNYERTKSYIAIGARRADGHMHFEVVAAARGTDWVIPWFNAVRPGGDKPRKEEMVAVAVQLRGAPVSDMIEPMKAAGIPVMDWGGSDLITGTARFFKHITSHTGFHRPQPILDRAAAGAVGRTMGDTWLFDRRNSPVDAAPLIACAAACWAESEGPPIVAMPAIHGWDEDEIARWEKQAQEDGDW